MNDDQEHRALPHTILKNTIYNLVTQGALIVVTMLALRIIVPGLNEEKFGLLSLIWVFIGYFTLLDFGISRAITKFLAEATVINDEKRSITIVWTSLSVSAAIGILTGGLLFILSHVLVHDVLKVSQDLQQEAVISFKIAAICLPFVLLYGALRGIMMALQRFSLTNLLQGGIGVLQWGGATILVVWGMGITQIILLTLIVRIAATVASFVLLPTILPGIFRSATSWSSAVGKQLLHFGGWVSVTQVVGPVIVYLDRVLIANLLSLSAVGFYSVPQEAVTRLLTLPMSLSLTLYPALSEKNALESVTSGKPLYTRSLKYLLLVMLPLVILLVAFAPDVLRIWMGDRFASQSSVVLQILGIGLLFNGIAQIPATTLHAVGRPDLPAKFNLVELPMTFVLNFFFISAFGIVGAAIAWTLRSMLDVVLLLWAVRKFVFRPSLTRMPEPKAGRGAILSFIIILLSCITLFVMDGFLTRLFLAILFCVVYVGSVWLYGFSKKDREFVLSFRAHMFK